MSFENLSSEQMEKVKACKTAEELEKLAEEEGFELSDEMLEPISGGAPCFHFMRCPKAVDTSGRPCNSYVFR